jgi:hypothetical protein
MSTFIRRIKRVSELFSLTQMARQVANHVHGDQGRLPIIFFNASTRLSGLSQNAAFSLLASWAVRLAGVRVIHFICWSGMSRCLLGTDQDAPEQAMPCKLCTRQSKVNTTGAEVRIFTYQQDDKLATVLQSLSLNELLRYEQPLPDIGGTLP